MYKLLLVLLISTYLYSNTTFSEEELSYISNKKVIYVSNEFDYEPYDFNREGKPSGYSIELLKLIFRDSGLKIEFITKDWDSLLSEVENKKIDLIHTIYKTPQREEKLGKMLESTYCIKWERVRPFLSHVTARGEIRIQILLALAPIARGYSAGHP